MNEPNRDCLNADTLAAWADGALDARARAAVEAHAADCQRCQALLAAMIRTEPPIEAKAWWRMPALGWLVPLTVAVTAMVIWIAVPTRDPMLVSDHGAAPADQSAPVPARTSAPTPAAASATAPLADAKASAAPEAQPESRVASSRDAVSSPPAFEDARERRDVALEKQALSAASGAVPAAAAPAAPPPVQAARALTFANAVETVIVSSNPSTRFRLLRGGTVQRTSDGGATWRTESTGATDTLTAGSSPSPSVCWLVGASGVVLLSTDGRSWNRVPFSEKVDLRSVAATDSESATVTTADGRSFTTSDGRTWSRTPDI